jgi:chromatin assembly factor 1 subunit B
MDLPARRISSNSPAPPDFGLGNHRAAFVQDGGYAIGSPAPSAPGTPQSLALPMNPPPTSHSRRSSFGSQMGGGTSVRRSVSPSPSMPLPAVMPSASPSISGSFGVDVRNANLYANETFTSFFRRLTFAPDGSLLFTPAGQYKTSSAPGLESTKKDDDVLNTVYIYTRAGLNKPPVAHLPGHKKPSIAVKCSPVYYNLRVNPPDTEEITIDTKAEDDIPLLPEPAHPTKAPTSHASMDPPPLAPSPSPSVTAMTSPRNTDLETGPTNTGLPAGPVPAFGLPYRVVYAVATQDAVHVYDTQQTKPICVVSNLHYATFTDLTWSSDGQTLLMTSSDGFCSALTFSPGELGTVHHPPPSISRHTPTPISVARANSAASTPQATPTTVPAVPAMTRQPSSQTNNNGIIAPPPAPPASPFSQPARPVSPARSMSTSSAATQSSFAYPPDQNPPPVMNNPTPSMSSVPSMIAAGSGASGPLPLFTPPQTPGGSSSYSSSVLGAVNGIKRESIASESSEENNGNRDKRRRIAPTLVEMGRDLASVPSRPPQSHPASK